MIFSKSKRNSKNYNVKPKAHKNTKPLTFAKECSTFLHQSVTLYRKCPQGSLHKFSYENGQKMNEKTIKTLIVQS